MQIFFVLILVLFSGISYAESPRVLTIAAASDLSFAMKELIDNFKKTTSDVDIQLILGSSGNFFTQIQHGAPFDMYFSADVLYPEKLLKSGHAVGKVNLYAIGRIVIWSQTNDTQALGVKALLQENIRRISIANPTHAPYGKRAQEFLESNNLWKTVQPKLILGENISQATQFVTSGNAEIGIIALSLALAPPIKSKGAYWLIPSEQHEPLKQGYVVLKRAEESPVQKLFSAYMKSNEAVDILSKYGFTLPSKH